MDLFSERLPLLSVAVVALLVAALAPRLAELLRLWKIPLIGQEIGNSEKRRQGYLSGARKLYGDGYRKVCLQAVMF